MRDNQQDGDGSRTEELSQHIPNPAPGELSERITLRVRPGTAIDLETIVGADIGDASNFSSVSEFIRAAILKGMEDMEIGPDAIRRIRGGRETPAGEGALIGPEDGKQPEAGKDPRTWTTMAPVKTGEDGRETGETDGEGET